MLFWKKRKIEPVLVQEEETPREVNTYGLNDVLHYINQETGGA